MNLQGISRIVKRLSLGKIAQLFGLDALTQARLGVVRSHQEMVELIAAVVLDQSSGLRGLTLLSSGTTRDPQPVFHSWQMLEAEVGSWMKLIPQARRVVSLVPSHHMYGLMWTVLWPSAANLEVIDLQGGNVECIRREFRPGDVVVGVPFQWRDLLYSPDRIVEGVIGVSSAGRLPETVWNAASVSGLLRMIEVYGSTETGGVAIRESFESSFQVAPHWIYRAKELVEVLPDFIARDSESSFQLLGRKDGAVKVAGLLVHLEDIEVILSGIEGVEDCNVRFAEGRIEAQIAFDGKSTDSDEFENRIKSELAERLPPHSLPRRYHFVGEFHRNELGKVTRNNQ